MRVQGEEGFYFFSVKQSHQKSTSTIIISYVHFRHLMGLSSFRRSLRYDDLSSKYDFRTSPDSRARPGAYVFLHVQDESSRN